MAKYYQHGDVLIRPEHIPTAARRVSTRVLAQGELTGHAHRVSDEAEAELYEHEGTLFLRVGPGGAPVTHEEHATRMIDAPGDYRIDRVREYDHFGEEARGVQD
jgi:hypothetical protein